MNLRRKIKLSNGIAHFSIYWQLTHQISQIPQLHPEVPPQVLHFMQVPFRTSV